MVPGHLFGSTAESACGGLPFRVASNEACAGYVVAH